jgi:transcriptional regulator with GAF, ATPase, and Fis domain
MCAQKVIEQVDGERLVGQSPAIRHLIQDIAVLAPTEAMVILYGETGVGKDLVARLIHANSRRRAQSFVPVDCATIPDDLWESECFGSVTGAFTGRGIERGYFGKPMAARYS